MKDIYTLNYMSDCSPFDYYYFQNPGYSVLQPVAVYRQCNYLSSIDLSRWNVVWMLHYLCVYESNNPGRDQ